MRDLSGGLERVDCRKVGDVGARPVVDHESRDPVLCPSWFSNNVAGGIAVERAFRSS